MESDATDTMELLRGAVAGAQEAKDALFFRYYPVVLRIVAVRMRRNLQDHEVEDLCQETLLEAFQGLHAFRYTSRGDFCNWLARIAENNIRDRVRRENAQKRGKGVARLTCDLESSSLTESIFPGKEPTPSENARGHELEERIAHALSHRIGERYREVILLRDLCRMSFEEIAANLGYSGASTARALYTRAKQKLKEYL